MMYVYKLIYKILFFYFNYCFLKVQKQNSSIYHSGNTIILGLVF